MAMNLGEANLKTVNTSRPQLLHTDSKRSIAASDDYYSLSDHTSEASSGDDRTIRRYNTPPSQIRSPNASRDLIRSEQRPLSTIQSENLTADSSVKNLRFDESQAIPRKPVPDDNMKPWANSRSDVSPPTPGVDDTPYIQFAIDQLTRDEELLGRRRDGIESGDVSPIGDEETAFDDRPISKLPEEPPIPLRDPARATNIRTETAKTETNIGNIMMPAIPPQDTFRYLPLNFVPKPLRILSLAGLIICCLLMLVALIFSSVWSSKHYGLWVYDGTGTSRYFLFEFLPQMLASVIVLWLLVVQAALQRILPFALLASKQETENVLYDIPLFLTNYLIPNLSFFRHGEPLLGLCSMTFWLCLFTVPLQSCIYQTRLFTIEEQGIWIWDTVQPVAWTLIALYFLLILALILVFFRFTHQSTGLKWDPDSLADMIVLLGRSNVVSGDNRSEKRARRVSLGYWETSDQPGQLFHSIGEDHAPAHQQEKGKARADTPEGVFSASNVDLEAQSPGKEGRLIPETVDVHSPAVRYHWIPWYLRETWVICWAVTAFVLMIAFIVVSFVNRAVAVGFQPLVPAGPTSLAFSSANFLYNFLPSLLGMILFLLWQPIDVYFRALQPYANLANPRGATAEESLLLDYTACLPVEVTIKAVLAGHFKLAWISAVAFCSIVLPILGGGIFTAQFMTSSQQIREAATMPAYYALVVFVILYALSFPAMWPTRRRYLPHDIRTLGNVIGYVYQSSVLYDATFRDPLSKTDLVTRLISSEQSRFAFGVYVGRDGREHLGIDRLQRRSLEEVFPRTRRA